MPSTYNMMYLAVLLALIPVSAQADDDNDVKSIERITVTGSRMVESLDEVPASITLIDQQQLKENRKRPAITSFINSLITHHSCHCSQP